MHGDWNVTGSLRSTSGGRLATFSTSPGKGAIIRAHSGVLDFPGAARMWGRRVGGPSGRSQATQPVPTLVSVFLRSLKYLKPDGRGSNNILIYGQILGRVITL